MKLRFRKKDEIETYASALPLELTSAEGTPWDSFAGMTVNQIRQMISRVEREGPFPKRLSMIAALRQEGVTHLSRALATTLANDTEKTVCLVELNWWWPEVLPEMTDQPGLAAVLEGEAALDDVIQETNYHNLFLVPSGTPPQHTRSVLARRSILEEMIQALGGRFDHLILDIPAVMATTDAAPLASHGTAVCMVIHQGVTSVEDARLALDEVSNLPVLGVVMNNVKLETPELLLKFIPQK